MLSSGAVHSPEAVTLKGATPEVGVTFSVHVGCASAGSTHNRQSSARVMNMPRRMVSSPRRDRRGVFTTSTSQKWLERARSFRSATLTRMRTACQGTTLNFFGNRRATTATMHRIARRTDGHPDALQVKE